MKSFQTQTAYRFLLQFIVLVVCWALVHAAPAYAVIRYVKPTATGTGDGSSWANASANLQAMINASAAADEVWVAAGTYKPTAYPTGCTGCSTNRDYAFHLKNGVKLYGGFAGTETAVSQRNISANPTILSGDFNGNDVVTGSGSTLSITGITENAYHVVLSVADDATTILDGFTVTGGHASVSGSITVEGNGIVRDYGGGMFNRNTSPTITNATFSGNPASSGGGMYNNGSSPIITNATFIGNTATNSGGGMYNSNSSYPSITNTTFSGNAAGQGGGMFNFDSSSPTITNATFSGNAANVGGGIYNGGSSPSITNTTFSGNTANIGGGMYNSNSSPTITNVTFSGNTATNGGGLFNQNFSSPTITNTTFSGNTATNRGGGIYNNGTSPSITNTTFSGNTANIGGGMYNSNSSPTITNVTFSGNTATNGGGLFNQNFSSPTITNTTFSGNTATNRGGGIYNNGTSPSITNTTFSGNTANIGGGMHNTSSSPSITNATFSGNAASQGGGIVNLDTSSPSIRNCILWGNGTEIVNLFDSNPTISFSIVQGGYTGATNANPLFVNPANPAGPDGIHRTADDGLRLQAGSPAINAGSNALIPTGVTIDITGAARILGGTVDMGAFEWSCPVSTTLYVDASVSSTGTGESWASAFKSLDEALNTAWNCPDVNRINVATGAYIPSRKPYNTDGSEMTTTDNRDKTFHLRNGVAMYGGYPAGGSATQDVTANPTILSGDFNGNDVVTGSGSTLSITGNGENAYHVVLSISDDATTIFDGFTVTGGNAVQNNNIFVESTPIIRNSGGGMYNFSSSPTITNTTFSGNTATNGGGMYNISFSNPLITNTTFFGNTANNGGGMYNISSSSPTISNTTFSGNAAGQGGGMFNFDSSSPTITNATFSGNAVYINGGGMFNFYYSSPGISNCILWGNGTEIVSLNDSNPTISFSIVQGGYAGCSNCSNTNGNANPLFVNPANPAGPDGIHRTADDGLRLQTGSPAINAGSNALIPTGITTDIIGADRIQFTTVDMGAYEADVVCPELTSAPDVAVIVNSTCSGCALSSGSVSEPTDYRCPNYSTLQYSTNGTDWSTTVPEYNQTTAITIYTRCNCDADTNISSPVSSVTTTPGICTPVSAGITGTTTGCNTVSLTATGGSIYTWSDGNAPLSATNTFTNSGTYTVIVAGTNGCFAFTSAVVVVTPSTSNTTTASACDSYTWSANGQTYTTSGNYTHTVGCHTEILDLAITVSTSNTTTASACDSYTWSANGQTYTTSGNYTHTVGCHTEILDLAITVSTSNTTTASACDSYIWSANGQTYTTSGNYTHTVGCHTEILDLTITVSTSNTTTASACDSYTWSANGQTYTTSGNYTHTVGCHTEILDLAITVSTSNTTTASACDTYYWDVDDNTYTTTGIYYYTVGCHTEILDLTIIPTTGNTTTIIACGSYTWAISGQTYLASGIHTVQVTDCHTEILDLTIPPGLVVSLNGNTNVCAGGVIGLIATGGNQYQWSGPNGYSATGGSITRTNATVAMSGAYTVTITNNECSTVLSITVTVHPIPNAAITGATSVCSGGTIGFSVPAGAVGYAWTGPAGFTAATNAIALPNATTGMSGTYKVTVTGAGGCTASGSRTVSVNAPTAAAITGATTLCAGVPLVLTCTTAGISYQWSGPGGFSFSGATMTRTPAVAGTYTVTVTNASGCISTASRTVTLNAAPNVVVTNNSNCTRIWLVASGGNSYAWSGPNGYTVTGATVLRNPATASMFGVYTVTVTGTGGCTASASITVNPCSGKTQSLPPDLSLSAYPNPTPGIVHISFTNTEEQEVMLAIYTADGKEVNTLFTGFAEAYTNYTLRFDASYLPNGVYYAVLWRSGGQREQLPIMVVK